jgi:4-hydroxy-tetrahydrodipicolinate reductase
MGQSIAKLVIQDKDLTLAGATEKKGHPLIGKTPLSLGIKSEIKISENIEKITNNKTIIIDFTAPPSTINNVKTALTKKSAIVIGTTGFKEDGLKIIKDASKIIPCVMAPNMSVGVNLLFKLVKDVTKILGPEYDIEIVEAHHRFKKDAPSGTAIKLAENIAAAKGESLEDIARHGRKGITGERKSNVVGIHAIRAGDIIGEHQIIFSSLGERVELTHKAHSRDTFASGAIRAAKFLSENNKPGLYSMGDVLNI